MNIWDEKYGQESWHYGEVANDFLREHLALFQPGQRALCLGAGEGRNALELLRKGLQVQAIDLSPVGLAKLQSKAQELGFADALETQAVNFMEFPIEKDKYDLITAIWFHGPQELKDRVARLAHEALRPGGYFLLEAYIPQQLQFKTGGPPTAEFMYQKKDLEKAFADFEIITSQELEREIQEGVGHSGPSAVVQFLAGKPL